MMAQAASDAALATVAHALALPVFYMGDAPAWSPNSTRMSAPTPRQALRAAITEAQYATAGKAGHVQTRHQSGKQPAGSAEV
jgi:hypothetical protein